MNNHGIEYNIQNYKYFPEVESLKYSLFIYFINIIAIVSWVQ